ncbi:glycerophosphodiester phosphodiesterase [Chelativorans sp. AA-79]|uniref:glycerophosphodiester phosphodiesterase n=1 Tax=Chelativorans sp. AA-79 TaxID=3028735 RepID=UPI0023F7CDEF|nr:glycerophosphodiester phosphodiesterase [Chelativorans sp. AA-79]WEX11740.1 glycerophosphodiester phosphodiesterase [Chelativorans sp. AA-79]
MTDLSWLTARPVAHRGLHDMNGERWENTPAAFRAAMERGYAIECDVHMSADGVPVIFHDHELNRLTGRDGKVWQRTAAELCTLAIGGTQERIPTLADTLSLVNGTVPLVIELKGAVGHDEGLVDGVLARLRGYQGQVALMSFDHRILRELGRKAQDVPIGLTAEGEAENAIEAHFSMLAHRISFVSYAVAHLPNPFIAFVRGRLSMPVITWTVRNEADMEKSFRYADQITFEGFVP